MKAHKKQHYGDIWSKIILASKMAQMSMTSCAIWCPSF